MRECMAPLVVTTGVKPASREWFSEAEVFAVGTFEMRVCAQCGFTELYAKNANEKLTELSRYPGSGVSLLDAGTPRGPFR